MSSFDYRAPAELFLAKRRRAAPNTVGSRRRLRPSATRSRTYERPKPSAHGWRLGTSRFNSAEIQRLYEAEDYPLRKAVVDGCARTSFAT